MKKLVFAFALFGFVAASTTPAFAIKEFNDQWTKHYVESSDNAAFKELAASAKCNVCHVNGEKKSVRNEYGAAIGKVAKAKELKPLAKSDPKKFEEELNAAFAKVADVKAKDGKTFGEKIKAGELPGGDKDGK
jgi:hypothetical protein